MDFGLDIAERAIESPHRVLRALIIAASGFEESELLLPYYRLLEEGLQVDVASLRRGLITGKHGYPVRATLVLREVDVDRYDALVVPGGKAPHTLIVVPDALGVVQRFNHAGKPIAAICHGLELLAAAGVLEGRNVTAHPSLAAAVALAGGIYEDREVLVDHNIITSRQPADLPAFMRALLRSLASYSESARLTRARAASRSSRSTSSPSESLRGS